jgi:hypothetical protein
MFFENDWIMRQINLLVQFVAHTVFRKDTVAYNIEDEDHLTDTDKLYRKLQELLKEDKICEAEDLLFDNYADTDAYLALALDFYLTVAKRSDEELERCNFSRQEVYDGIKESVMRHSGIPEFPFSE